MDNKNKSSSQKKRDRAIEIKRRETERNKRREEHKKQVESKEKSEFRFDSLNDNDAHKKKPYSSKEDFKFSNNKRDRENSQEGNTSKPESESDLDQQGLGSTKHHRQQGLNKAKEMVNDGKDIANAMSQKNTLKDMKDLKNGLKGVNPFSLKSIKNGLDNTVNQGAKMGLDKAGGGAGTIVEKVAKYIPFMKKTKDGKINYAKSTSKIKILLWLIAIGIFLFTWIIIGFIILAVVMLGSSYFAVTSDMTLSGSSSKPKTEEATTDTNNKSTGSVSTPEHLKGVVLPPVTIFANSGYGNRTLDSGVEFHYGYDFQEPGGVTVPVYANIEGTVVGIQKSPPPSAKGYYVAIYNEDKEVVVSNQHMVNPATNNINLNVGDKVKIDTIIGYQGGTGSGGAVGYPTHVHIDTMINMKPAMVKDFNILAYYNKSGHVVPPDSVINCGGGMKPPSKPGVGVRMSECYSYAKKVRKLK